jgi:hypothetical protein
MTLVCVMVPLSVRSVLHLMSPESNSPPFSSRVGELGQKCRGDFECH